MRTHLRHCPKHRKPLPCAHCALAAKPVQAPPEIETPVVELAPAKRGRKPLHDTAMSSAERQAKSRADRKAKRDDAQRRSLIVKLMKMYDRQQSDVIVIDHAVTQAENRREVDRVKRRQYLDGLKAMSLTELQQAVEGNDIPDSRGTLQGETTGGFDEKKFEAVVERDYRESGSTEDNPRFAVPVKPGGSSPDNPTEKSVGGRWARVSGIELKKYLNVEEKFREIVAHYLDANNHCKVPNCSFVAKSFDDAEEHFWAEYHAGEKLWDKVDKLSDPEIIETTGPLLPDARKNAMKNLHHYYICGWLHEASKPGPRPKAA